MALVGKSILLALAVCMIIPVTGVIVSLVFTKFFGGLMRQIDRTGTLFMVFANILTFPGVMIHEISHALFAKLSGAKVCAVHLYKPDGGSLGSVDIQPKGGAFACAIQMAVSSCAPVITGLMSEIILVYVIKNKNLSLIATIGLIYLAVSIFAHMDMSLVDVKNYIMGIVVIYPIIFVFSVIFFWLEIDHIVISSFESVGKNLLGILISNK